MEIKCCFGGGDNTNTDFGGAEHSGKINVLAHLKAYGADMQLKLVVIRTKFMTASK